MVSFDRVVFRRCRRDYKTGYVVCRKSIFASGPGLCYSSVLRALAHLQRNRVTGAVAPRSLVHLRHEPCPFGHRPCPFAQLSVSICATDCVYLPHVYLRHGPCSFAPPTVSICATVCVHLRHGPCPFAPRSMFICAADRVHLRHGLCLFAPRTVFICATDCVYLRHGPCPSATRTVSICATDRVHLCRWFINTCAKLSFT